MKRTDRWLAALEMGLVLGLAGVLVLSNNALRRLNEAAPVTHYTPPARPTPSPTPLIRLVALPTSALMPAYWEATPRPLAPPGLNLLMTPAAVLPLVPPTANPARLEGEQLAAHATGLVIPAIQLDAPVIHGVGAESLQRGVGHYNGSANPGEAGNVVLAGHNDVYGEVFRYLDQLQPGDELTLYSRAGAFRYVVREWRIVEPTEVSVLAPTASGTVTLISCYPYRIDTQRIIVVGDLLDS